MLLISSRDNENNRLQRRETKAKTEKWSDANFIINICPQKLF